MNGAEREPNCWLRIRGGPSDGKWYRAYLAPSAIPVAVKRGKARYLRVNPPAPAERYDPSSVEEDPAPLPIGVTDWETYSVRALREMAERAEIPVVTTLLGTGNIPESHSLSLGMAGMHGEAYANLGLHGCDVLIAMGAIWLLWCVGGPINHPQEKEVHDDS